MLSELAGADELPEPMELKDLAIPELHQILIDCKSEEEQRELYEELQSRNFKCKIVNL